MAKAEMIDSKTIKRWQKEIDQKRSESHQKVAMEFLNLDSEDIDALKAFAQKYAEKDPEMHVATDVAFYMKGDIEKLQRLQREFKDDVVNIIHIKPQYKDRKPLDRVSEKLIKYIEGGSPEWQIDPNDEYSPYLLIIPDNERYFPAILYQWLVHAIIEKRVPIQLCAASDCEEIFIARQSGRKQEYHSKTCYWRERKRKEKAQKI